MKTTIAAIQMRCGQQDNIAAAAKFVQIAANNGANIILLPELFERPYFCKTQRHEFLNYATTADNNAAIQTLQPLSKKLNIVLPVSFYERAGNVLFNSLIIVDNGKIIAKYRKSHLPDGPGYQEKFYFSPGNSGFFSTTTKHGNVGAAICWDQWFPEAARIMTLAGADVLLYPTAIGNEPHLCAAADSANHWQNAMCGHAAANLVPIVAANRIGDEEQQDAFGNTVKIQFYGSSFITDCYGNVVAQAARDKEEIIAAEMDFAANAEIRTTWGVFRDRRPDLYHPLITLEGK